jgi:signal peptidase I
LLLNTFVIVPAWAHLLRKTWVQAFRIPSGGMEPTLLIGDHVLADKAAFGIRLPFSSSTVLGKGEPRRGDLIVFLFPEDRSRVFLKRVIGLPGEKVEIRGETVYIADRPLEERYLSFLHLRGQNPFPNWGPKTVPAGHLFVLGDNLDTSRDSRFWGFLPVDDVLGQAKVVYFSWDETSEHTRWKRIGLTLR